MQQHTKSEKLFDVRDTYGNSILVGGPVNSESIARGTAKAAIRTHRVEGRVIVVRIYSVGAMARERLLKMY